MICNIWGGVILATPGVFGNMTPNALVKSIADADLKIMVTDVLAWRRSGILAEPSALRVFADLLVSKTGLDEEYSLQHADALVITEAASRFAAQQKDSCRE